LRFDVYADLDHLYMLNFSVDAAPLAKLVPPPLRVLRKRGRGFPSIVLPSIKRLRPVVTRFPAVDYELCGLRILVEYGSQNTGITKGIYFARLIMDPAWVRMIAGLVTPFDFEAGHIDKRRTETAAPAAGGVATAGAAPELGRSIAASAGPGPAHRCQITVEQGGKPFLRADVSVETGFPDKLTPGSVFTDSNEALATYNDISYGFIPSSSGTEVKVLQIADPHPNYVAWPLVSLAVDDVWVQALHDAPLFEGSRIVLEPSFFVGRLPRYWRWLQTERLAEPVRGEARVPGNEPVQ
jgi:hypothetical protein